MTDIIKNTSEIKKLAEEYLEEEWFKKLKENKMEEFACYDENLCNKQELNKPLFKEVAEGDYKGIHWCIRSLGMCPLAYVSIPVEQQDKLESLVHGGLSFWNDKLANKDDNRKYFGWDYGHCCDYMEKPTYVKKIIHDYMDEISKKYTVSEVIEDIKNAIDHL